MEQIQIGQWVQNQDGRIGKVVEKVGLHGQVYVICPNSSHQTWHQDQTVVIRSPYRTREQLGGT